MKTLFFIIVTISSLTAFAFPEGQVMVGGSDFLDACPQYGIITQQTKLYRQEVMISYLYTKDIVETVDANQGVFLCDSQVVDGVEYLGVVIQDDHDCDVSSPEWRRSQYSGSCKSGWVEAKYFELTAG